MAHRVLIVDDSALARRFVRRVLELSGFEVEHYLEAGNGMEAIKVILSGRVDLVLTDINMPEMDGEDFIFWLNQNEWLRRLPVIVVSSDSCQIRIRRLTEIGVRGYVAKPFTPEVLRSEIDRVIGRAA